jgi:hypothetical protein
MIFPECISPLSATKTPKAERAARGRSPGNHRPTDAGEFINFQENDKTSRIRPRSQDLLM